METDVMGNDAESHKKSEKNLCSVVLITHNVQCLSNEGQTTKTHGDM